MRDFNLPLVPKPLESVNQAIEVLRYIERMLKMLPSLPSGELRDQVELELVSASHLSMEQLKLVSTSSLSQENTLLLREIEHLKTSLYELRLLDRVYNDCKGKDRDEKIKILLNHPSLSGW